MPGTFQFRSALLLCAVLSAAACDMQPPDGGNSNHNSNSNDNHAAGDADGDGVDDAGDNCLDVSNPQQGDVDADGVGNSCDNCTDVPNPDQRDGDFDGTGDACETLPGDNSNDNADPGNDNANDNAGQDNQNDNQHNGNDNGAGLNPDVPEGFPPAEIVSFDAADRIVIEDQIDDGDEVLVFDLGPHSLGDRLDVLCDAVSGSTLDPMIALFDADGSRVFWNDDINPAISDFSAGFDDLIRHDDDHYFLALTSTSFFNTSGPFRCVIQRQQGAGLEAVSGHTVVLRWSAAADVEVAGIEFGDLPVFDGGSISPVFSGDTAELMARIEHVVVQDFAAFGLNVLTSDDAAPAGQFTTVYFGVSADQSIFGIADDIDFYNADTNDNAIIILDAFHGLSSNVQTIGLAVGNVASHEIGHTLGLMHTTDVTELMDTTGSASTLLADQSFGVAEIFDFPIGRQDAPLLLGETVGLITRPADQASNGRRYCGTCGGPLGLLAASH